VLGTGHRCLRPARCLSCAGSGSLMRLPFSQAGLSDLLIRAAWEFCKSR
jgi:hypothetical protein